MPAPSALVFKFASSIIATLGYQDRVIFKGHLAFFDEAYLNCFVDHTLGSASSAATSRAARSNSATATYSPRLVFTCRPQRFLYFYFLDPEFGLRHFRVQTRFRFTTQVYVNGIEANTLGLST